MKIKKLAAIAGAALFGVTMAAAANAQLSTYVSHTGGTLTSPMVVIGSTAGDATNYPKDVVAAADLAAHVAGYATTPVASAGGEKTFSLSGEGQEVATANTKIYLGDSLGKSGIRTTMTNDDLPTLLAAGSIVDKNSTTIKYDQFLFLTPSSTSSANYKLQFERPSSSSSDDGTYSFGRFSTSPSSTNYFLNYRLNFRKGAQAQALVGKTLEIAGETYTVLSDSTSESGTIDLVMTKASASQSILVSDGPVTVSVGSTTYEIQIIGTSDSNTVVVSVNGVSASATKSATTNIGGVDVYVDDVFHFANNQESSGATLLIGAEKVIFQHGSKIKVGSNEDNVDGTWVNITSSSGKYDTIDIFLAAPESSVTDNLHAGGSYTLPGLSTIALYFPGISEDMMVASRNSLALAPSGDNLMQATWTDDSGNTGTVTWAYKATASGTSFSLADSNNNPIHVVEATPVAQDQMVVFDAGDFPHLMQLTSIDSSALSFTLQDIFTGDSVKYELAVSDNGQKTIYIDGQAYHAAFNKQNTTVNFTWGDGAGADSVGDATTVWPTLKGANGELLAFLNSTGATLNVTSTGEIQLPTGAVTMSIATSGLDVLMNLTAATDEDGESSACTTTPCVDAFNLSVVGETSFILGKTATGGFRYNLTAAGDQGAFTIKAVGSSSETAAISQPGILLIEEKDDASNRYSVLVTATTETSGSNNVAIPAAPIFTATEESQTRGSDSTITDYVDLYGTFAVRTTSGQDTLTIYYPDGQVYAIVGAGMASATAAIGGSAGTTVDAAVVITSPVAKLDNEVNTATLASDLVLVGGPCANALVAELAAVAENGIPACDAWTLTTGLIKEVDDAFGSGRKALVVAGTTADDTRSLAANVMQGTLSYEV